MIYLLRKNFNIYEFINTYMLTRQEYALMNFKSRMIYGERIFANILNQLPNIGSEITIKGHIHPTYFEFFEWCGITCENTGGALERCRIVRTNYGNSCINFFTKKDVSELDRHIYKIAATKAQIIMDHTFDPDLKLDLIPLEAFYNSLDEDLKYAYADSVYGRLIDSFSMNIAETRFINVEIPKCFDWFFSKKGYTLRRMEDETGKKILCIKNSLAAKEKIGINTNERLMTALNEREELIRRASKLATGIFTPEYANKIRFSSADQINHVGEINGLTQEELNSILKAECQMLFDMYKEKDYIKLEHVGETFRKYLEELGLEAKSIKPCTYKLEIKKELQ